MTALECDYPFQWSSEHRDRLTELVYYNFRYYNFRYYNFRYYNFRYYNFRYYNFRYYNFRYYNFRYYNFRYYNFRYYNFRYYNFRYYNPCEGRWTSRDPLMEQYDHNLYRFVENKVSYSIDIAGLDRYITQSDVLGIAGTGNTNIHVSVGVDTWGERDGKYIRTGQKTFDFGPRRPKVKDLLSPITTAIGVSSALGVGLGEVTSSDRNTVKDPITIESNPCQDKKLLEKLEQAEQNPPCYHLTYHNCITWSWNQIFNGMDDDDDDDEKCCNPDGTLWKRKGNTP